MSDSALDDIPPPHAVVDEPISIADQQQPTRNSDAAVAAAAAVDPSNEFGAAAALDRPLGSDSSNSDDSQEGTPLDEDLSSCASNENFLACASNRIGIEDLDPEDQEYDEAHLNRDELDTTNAENVINELGGERLLLMAQEAASARFPNDVGAPGSGTATTPAAAAAGASATSADDEHSAKNSSRSFCESARAQILSIRTAIAMTVTVLVGGISAATLTFFLLVTARPGLRTSLDAAVETAFQLSKGRVAHDISLPESIVSLLCEDAARASRFSNSGFLTDSSSPGAAALRRRWFSLLATAGQVPGMLLSDFSVRFANDASVASLRLSANDALNLHLYRPAAGSGFHVAGASSSPLTAAVGDLLDASQSYSIAIDTKLLASTFLTPGAGHVQSDRTAVYSELWNRTFDNFAQRLLSAHQESAAAATAVSKNCTTSGRGRGGGWPSFWELENTVYLLNPSALPNSSASVRQHLAARQLSRRVTAAVLRDHNSTDAAASLATASATAASAAAAAPIPASDQFALVTGTLPMDNIGMAMARGLSVAGAHSFLMDAQHNVVAWSHGYSHELITATERQSRTLDRQASQECAFAGPVDSATGGVTQSLFACLHEFYPLRRASGSAAPFATDDSSSSVLQQFRFTREELSLQSGSSAGGATEMPQLEPREFPYSPSMEVLREAAKGVRARLKKLEEEGATTSTLGSSCSNRNSSGFTFGIGERSAARIVDAPLFYVKAAALPALHSYAQNRSSSSSSTSNYYFVAVFPTESLVEEVSEAREGTVPILVALPLASLFLFFLLLGGVTHTIEDLTLRVAEDPWNPAHWRRKNTPAAAAAAAAFGERSQDSSEASEDVPSSPASSSLWCCGCCETNSTDDDHDEPWVHFAELEMVEDAFAALRKSIRRLRSFMQTQDAFSLINDSAMGAAAWRRQQKRASLMMSSSGGDAVDGDVLVFDAEDDDDLLDEFEHGLTERFRPEHMFSQFYRAAEALSVADGSSSGGGGMASSASSLQQQNNSDAFAEGTALSPMTLGGAPAAASSDERTSCKSKGSNSSNSSSTSSTSPSLPSAVAAEGSSNLSVPGSNKTKSRGRKAVTFVLDSDSGSSNTSTSNSLNQISAPASQQEIPSSPPLSIVSVQQPSPKGAHSKPPFPSPQQQHPVSSPSSPADGTATPAAAAPEGYSQNNTTTQPSSPPTVASPKGPALKNKGGYVNILAVAVNFYNFHASIDDPLELLQRGQIIVSHMAAMMRLLGAALIEFRGDHFMLCLRIKTNGYSKLVTRLLQELMNTAKSISETALYMEDAGCDGPLGSPSQSASLNVPSPSEQQPQESSSRDKNKKKRKIEAGEESSLTAADAKKKKRKDQESEKKTAVNRQQQQQSRRGSDSSEASSTASGGSLTSSNPSSSHVASGGNSTDANEQTGCGCGNKNANSEEGKTNARFRAGAKKSLVLSAGVAHAQSRVCVYHQSSRAEDRDAVARHVAILGPCFAEAAALERFIHSHPAVLSRSYPVPHAIAMRESQLRVLHGAEVELVQEVWDFVGNGPHRGGGTLIAPRLEHVISQQQGIEAGEVAAVKGKGPKVQQALADVHRSRHLVMQRAVRSLQPPQGVVRVYTVKPKRTLLNTPVDIPGLEDE